MGGRPRNPRRGSSSPAFESGVSTSRASARWVTGAPTPRDAIRRAIAACASEGGGRVVVPAGRFATGPIHLRSNVKLHVSRDATLLFARDPRQYLPAVLTRFEGTELMNYSPFIYAFDQRNIAITGEGTLDGQADREHWWPWKGSRRLRLDAAARRTTTRRDSVSSRWPNAACRSRDAASARATTCARPFIQPYRCRNVLIEDVTIVELADVGDPSRALRERHRARREDLERAARTTTAAIRSRAATSSSSAACSTPATTASRSSPGATPTAAA